MTEAEQFHAVRDYLQSKGVPIVEAQLELTPTTTVRVEGETATKAHAPAGSPRGA
jgi:transcriptional/translational regulatory protein YebC/TACO1